MAKVVKEPRMAFPCEDSVSHQVTVLVQTSRANRSPPRRSQLHRALWAQ